MMAGRLPESWIAPDHILDLRARVRLRHTLVDERGEWQQRIHAVLYHHGCPHHHGIGLLTEKGRAWLESLGLPATAREQVTVALQMINAIDLQLAPMDKELRAYARRQSGCKALMGLYGIGHLTAVTILAELGDARRFSSSREAVRYSGLDITVKQSDRRRAPGHLSRQRPPALRWALYEAAQTARKASSPDRDLLPPGGGAPGRQPRVPRGRAQAAQARLPHPARARRRGARTRVKSVVRAQPSFSPMHRGRLPASSSRYLSVDGLQRLSGRNAYPSGITPSTIMSPARRIAGSWTKIRLGAHAQSLTNSASTAPVKRYALGPSGRPAGDRAPPLAPKGNHVGDPRTPDDNQPTKELRAR